MPYSHPTFACAIASAGVFLMSTGAHAQQWKFDYDAFAAGGTAFGTRGGSLQLELQGEVEREINDAHTLKLELGYERDPFALKTFNYDDVIEPDPRRRILQTHDRIESELQWEADWGSDIDTRLPVSFLLLRAENNTDDRWIFQVDPRLRIGGIRGFRFSLGARFNYQVYPNYEINLRKLDQYNLGIEPSLRYAWARSSNVYVRFGMWYRRYLESKYESGITANFRPIRATKDKEYFRIIPEVGVQLRPVRWIRLNTFYQLTVNDAKNYDRAVQFRDAANQLSRRFIENYFDYNRHRLRARARIEPFDAFQVTAAASFVVRTFSDYIVRNAQNQFLDDTRVDTTFGFDIEARYEVTRLHGNGKYPTSTLSAVAMLTHDDQSSNMEFERSFTTNFNVTRALVGIEITGL